MSKKKNRKAQSRSRPKRAAARTNGVGSQASKLESPSSPPNLTNRVWLTVLALVVVQGGVWAAREFAMPFDSREPSRPLSEFPYQIGEFTGEDKPGDPRVFQYLGTDMSISRVYTHSDGGVVSVHLAAWNGTDNWTPHPPDVCYRSAGWSEANRATFELPANPPIQVAHRLFQNAGQRASVMFWYRIGEIVYHEESETRAIRRQFVGQREWPPVVKILLQTEPGEENEQLLSEFAIMADAWMRTL